MIATEKQNRQRRTRIAYAPLAAGQRHSTLTLLALDAPNKWGQAMWKCRCDCGTEWTAKGTEINRGTIVRCRPCGDKSRTLKNTGRPCKRRLDLLGRTFGKLTVLRPAPTRDHRAYWWCLCLCGMESEIQTHELMHGHKKSCGCARYVRASKPKVEKPKKVRPPRPARPERKSAASPWNRSSPTYEHFTKPAAPAMDSDGRTALIVASRRTMTKWPDVADLVGLPIEECQRRHAEATA